jgi:hypothetical protein
MKKYFLLKVLISMIVLFGLTGCKNENEEETPNIYVSLRHSTTDNIPSLTWIVENRSKTSTVIFKEGDVLNYEITHTSSGQIVTNDEKETKDIILEPDESNETTIEFRDMPIGHYIATFWADWNDDRKSSMTIQFDVEK